MKYCEKKCIDSWLLLRCDQILNGQKLCIKETWLFVEKCRYIMKLQEGVKSLPTQLTVTCDHFWLSITEFQTWHKALDQNIKNFKNVEYLFLKSIRWFNRWYSLFTFFLQVFVCCSFVFIVSKRTKKRSIGFFVHFDRLIMIISNSRS